MDYLQPLETLLINRHFRALKAYFLQVQTDNLAQLRNQSWDSPEDEARLMAACRGRLDILEQICDDEKLAEIVLAEESKQ